MQEPTRADPLRVSPLPVSCPLCANGNRFHRCPVNNELVRKYKASPAAWPDGIGAWYRACDWSDAGDLIATGNDRARALDPYANDRAKDRPCPPIPGLVAEAVDKPVDKPPVDTVDISSVDTSVDSPVDRKAYQREWARKRRAKVQRIEKTLKGK